MSRNILVVDNDVALLRLVKAKYSSFTDFFRVYVAENSFEALEILDKNEISVVVADMKLEGMDGYEFFVTVHDLFPDIPFFAMTAEKDEGVKDNVLEKGAVKFIEKPLDIDRLAQQIKTIIEKESEGGNLKNASLEMFIQLIEMEQKTCTLRIFDVASASKGVLFFQDGELLNARIRNINGNSAAYTIFSWEEVTLSIENFCAQQESRIDGDLQAILLEAMRLKDETEHPHPDGDDEVFELECDESGEYEDDFTIEDDAPGASVSESILLRLSGEDDEPPEHVLGIEEDIASAIILANAEKIGDIFNSGRIRVSWISSGKGPDLFYVPAYVPESGNIKITADGKCNREKIITQLLGG